MFFGSDKYENVVVVKANERELTCFLFSVMLMSLGPVLRSRFERGCVELIFHLLLGIFGLHIGDKVNYTNGISEFVVIP